MNPIEFVTEHPVLSGIVAVAAVRIAIRDIGFAKNFIKVVNEEQAEQAKQLPVVSKPVISAKWDGVERRGPNRAKNVFRPAFGQTVDTPVGIESDEKATKTGTEG